MIAALHTICPITCLSNVAFAQNQVGSAETEVIDILLHKRTSDSLYSRLLVISCVFATCDASLADVIKTSMYASKIYLQASTGPGYKHDSAAFIAILSWISKCCHNVLSDRSTITS